MQSAKTVRDLEQALVVAKAVLGSSDRDLAPFEERLTMWSEPFQVKLVSLRDEEHNVSVRRSDTVSSLCLIAARCFGKIDCHTKLTSAFHVLGPENACLDAVGITDNGAEISVTFGDFDNLEKAGAGNEDTANPWKTISGVGSSASAYVQAYLIIKFLISGDLLVTKELVSALENEDNSRAHPLDGSLARREINDRAKGLSITLFITEPSLFFSNNSEDMERALAEAEKEHGIHFACAVSAPNLGATGHTFGVLVSATSVAVVDTHSSKDEQGQVLGPVVTWFGRDFEAVAEWIFSSLLTGIECTRHFDVVAVSVESNDSETDPKQEKDQKNDLDENDAQTVQSIDEASCKTNQGP